MSTAIIINPISGGARPRGARARAQLALAVVDAHGDPAEVLSPNGAATRASWPKAAVRRGARLVMAWGGDGTINEVASALAFDEVPLGIVPAGSGNGLARELGVSLRPGARRSPTRSRPSRAPIDLGELGGRLFVNIAGIGFDAHVAAQFADRPTAPRLRRLRRHHGARARRLRAARPTASRPAASAPSTARCS